MSTLTGLTLIVGLEQSGYMLRNAIMQYCQATGHSVEETRISEIYFAVVSQILSLVEVDPQAFAANIMAVPDYRAIHYLDTPINYEAVRPFTETVRSFALILYQRLLEKGNLQPGLFYAVEACTPQFIVVKIYDGTVPAEQL